jgi:hypothetical protein
LLEPSHKQPGLRRRFRRDQRGIIIIMFALMLPVIVGFIGLGVEVVYWFSASRNLQAAADAAALAGSYELAENRSGSIDTVAWREASGNGWSDVGGTLSANNPPTNAEYPAYLANTSAVEVELTQDINLMFAGYFLSSAVTINARAVGLAVAGSSESCILALGGSNGAKSLWVAGSATVTMTGCTASTNSTDDAAITTTSGLSVDCVYSAGGVSGTPTTTACSGAKENQPTVSDPYASITAPEDSDFSNCGSDGSNGDGGSYVGPNADSTIDPGVYCGITFSQQDKTLTLNAGTYYIDRGSLTSTGGTIDGTAGVTIVFGDSTGADNCGQVSFTGNSNVTIVAPITEDGEPFTGITFYIGSNCDPGEDIKIAGNNDSTIIGAVYNPNGSISITGTGSVGGTCLQLISDTMKITGNSDIGSDCDDVDVQTILSGGKGSLVE